MLKISNGKKRCNIEIACNTIRFTDTYKRAHAQRMNNKFN